MNNWKHSKCPDDNALQKFAGWLNQNFIIIKIFYNAVQYVIFKFFKKINLQSCSGLIKLVVVVDEIRLLVITFDFTSELPSLQKTNFFSIQMDFS